MVDGRPGRAVMTLARWPDDALEVLRAARDGFMASLEGPSDPDQKTDAQRDFSLVSNALKHYAASVGATKFDPGRFLGRSGLAPGEECKLVKQTVRVIGKH